MIPLLVYKVNDFFAFIFQKKSLIVETC